MNPLFEQKRVFLVGGPGGVGKTTLAAALGVRLAEAGHRTVVLTVDPARRLAQALGFSHFPREIERISRIASFTARSTSDSRSSAPGCTPRPSRRKAA